MISIPFWKLHSCTKYH